MLNWKKGNSHKKHMFWCVAKISFVIILILFKEDYYV